METMKIETMSKEIIKPSTATPKDLRTLQLSMLDQSTTSYVVAILFYTKAESISEEHISHKLKTSLSKTLTRFYPLAGRIDGVTIDCNDEGAVFVGARVVGDSPLSSFLKSHDFDSLQPLLPLDKEHDVLTWPLLLVKATYFQCGGMAIGICVSHKLADATSLSTFVRVWAATARGECDSVASPEFAATKLYPPAIETSKSNVPQPERRANVTKRFVFLASKLEELRNKAACAYTMPRPTRVQSVTSLLWKCVVASASLPRNTCEKVLIYPTNLRPKIPTLLSENLIGNLFFPTSTFNVEGDVKISETVIELKKRIVELESLIQEEPSKTIGSKLISEMMNWYSRLDGTQELYLFSSWCRMHFYEASFGWGSPIWVVGNVLQAVDNVILLMDSNDGEGIEAWVTLHPEDMSLFEQNPELLAFASPNLNVLV